MRLMLWMALNRHSKYLKIVVTIYIIRVYGVGLIVHFFLHGDMDIVVYNISACILMLLYIS